MSEKTTATPNSSLQELLDKFQYKPRSKPRDFYTDKSHRMWSEDQTTTHFPGFENRVKWPIIKSVAVTTVFILVTILTGYKSIAALVCILCTWYYRHVVALCVPNTIVMPTMDQQTYISSEECPVNFMNHSKYDEDYEEVFRERMLMLIKMHPKFRYRVKMIAGDYYYEEMSLGETLNRIYTSPATEDHVLRSQADIDNYIADNIGKKMPLDGPLVRLYLQKYDPIDMDHIPKEQRPKAIFFWKCHHSFCDGVSVLCLPLALSDEFSRDYFLKSTDATLLQRLAVKLLVPFQIPAIIKACFFTTQDVNPLTEIKQKKGLSGNLNMTISDDISLPRLKALAKAKGLTVNDVILSALMTALHMKFEERNAARKVEDRFPMPSHLNIVMPANIRFAFYESREKIKLENQFAGVPLRVPMLSTMEESYAPIKKITAQIKGSLGLIYGIFMAMYLGGKLGPREFGFNFVRNETIKFTAAFSNVAGPIKSFKYTNKRTGKVITNTETNATFVVAGNVGFSLAALSQVDKIRMSLGTDDNVLEHEENQRLLYTIWSLVQSEIIEFEKQQSEQQTKASSVTEEKTGSSNSNNDDSASRNTEASSPGKKYN